MSPLFMPGIPLAIGAQIAKLKWRSHLQRNQHLDCLGIVVAAEDNLSNRQFFHVTADPEDFQQRHAADPDESLYMSDHRHVREWANLLSKLGDGERTHVVSLHADKYREGRGSDPEYTTKNRHTQILGVTPLSDFPRYEEDSGK